MNGGWDKCLLDSYWCGTYVIGVCLNFYREVFFYTHISVSAYSCKTYMSERNNLVTCYCQLLSLCVASVSDVLLEQKIFLYIIRATGTEARVSDVLLFQKHITLRYYCSSSMSLRRASVPEAPY